MSLRLSENLKSSTVAFIFLRVQKWDFSLIWKVHIRTWVFWKREQSLQTTHRSFRSGRSILTGILLFYVSFIFHCNIGCKCRDLSATFPILIELDNGRLNDKILISYSTTSYKLRHTSKLDHQRRYEPCQTDMYILQSYHYTIYSSAFN